jgi:hypothetical protein
MRRSPDAHAETARAASAGFALDVGEFIGSASS